MPNHSHSSNETCVLQPQHDCSRSFLADVYETGASNGSAAVRFDSCSPAQLLDLSRAENLVWAVGPFLIRLTTHDATVVNALRFLYRAAPLLTEPATAITDFHLSVRSSFGGFTSTIFVDGQPIFRRVRKRHLVPMVEWALNLCAFQGCHHYLTVHAAVLERGGRVLMLPALSGSGKSTLCAALSQKSWRLFSDEVALIDLNNGLIHPAPRPISLKRDAIELIRQRFPQAILGPTWRGTIKGDVAHLLPMDECVARTSITGRPGWIVFPLPALRSIMQAD